MRSPTSLFARLLSGTLAAALLLSVAGLFPGVVHADPVPTPYLVKDINTQPLSSSPMYLTDVNGTIFFAARDSEYNTELWKSDGTEGGTVMVKDIYPGTYSGANPTNLTNHNGTLFFRANHGDYGQELWKSDGTEGGTVMVKDINPGYADSYVFSPASSAMGLFFAANNGVHGSELWKSDGTEAGTVMVKDINPGSSSSQPYLMVDANGMIFFIANNGVDGYELWKSDGTEAGTQMVKVINPRTDASYNLFSLTPVGDKVFFTEDDGVNGRELWVSDGTAGGTMMIELRIGSNTSNPGYLVEMAGQLYFSASGDAGTGLWVSDGTIEGTQLVTDISYIQGLIRSGNRLFFRGYDNVNGSELWISDGTSSGTYMLKDIISGSSDSAPIRLTDVNGTLYFIVSSTLIPELWKSDGTASGTVLVKAFPTVPGTVLNSFDYLTASGNVLFLPLDDGIAGRELWTSDGTDVGTHLVKDIRGGQDTSDPQSLIDVNGTIFFNATDGINGRELWTSDGTAAGTSFIDINPYGHGNPNLEAVLNGASYFSAYTSATGSELWRSDGTVAGTYLVKDIVPGSASGNPAYLTTVGNKIFFQLYEVTSGAELWITDGTEAGTVLVKDIRPGGSSSYPSGFIDLNGVVIFMATDSATGSELWRSDGTDAGTYLLKDINPGSSSSYIYSLTVMGNHVFFNTNDGVHGYELWKSDGTPGGTQMVADISPGSGSSNPGYLTALESTLLFSATDDVHGNELWKTDGSQSGTVMVTDILPGLFSGAYPQYMTTVGNAVYFRAQDSTHGMELWKSDGSASGTMMVADINPGIPSTYANSLINANGVLYFIASEDVHGNELWKSDGTEAGTMLVGDIAPGSGAPGISWLTVSGGKLYFAADNGTGIGRELWAVQIDSPVAPPASDPPALAIPNDLPPMIDGTVSVPVNFAGNGNDIVSAAFTIGFDTMCLSYNGATMDSGLSAAGYVLNIEDSLVVAGNVRFVIQPPLNETLPAFGEGSLLTLDFMVAPGPCSTTPTEIMLMDASFGNSAGASVVGTTSNGSVILNRPPVAEDDFATTDEDTSITIDLFANDNDPDAGGTFSLFSLDPTALGVLSNNGDGTVGYDPALNFQHLAQGQSATDTFNYTIIDSYGEMDSANVLITVTGVNDAPIGNEDTFQTDEDNPVTVDVIANDTDVDDGDVLSLGGVNPLSAIGSITSSGNQITYDPGSLFQHLGVGEEDWDVFEYTANDSFGGSGTVAIAVRITGVNDNPVADDDLAVTTPGTPVNVDVLTGDTDPDTNDYSWLTVGGVVAPTHGIATTGGYSVDYTPNPGFQGVEQFTYTVEDPHAGTDTGTITVAVGSRGDCNSDFATDAGDLPAIVLEYFDGDANGNWLDVINGSFPQGNPLGCDTNQDHAIGAGDLSCEARILLSNDSTLSCSGLLAAVNAAPARLSLGGYLRAAGKEGVPVTLETQGHAIAAAVFSLDLPDGLVFNPDRDLALSLPDGIQSLVLYDATDRTGELDLVVYSLSLQPLSDGVLATLNVPGGAVRFSSAVPASLGSVDGTTVPVITENWVHRIYLPGIAR